MKNTLYFIEFILAYPFIVLARILPIPAATFIARRLGTLAYILLIQRRRVAVENIEAAFGNTMCRRRKKEIAVESFRHAAVTFMELLIMPKILKKAAERFEFLDYGYMQTLVDRDKGIVFAISHLGSFEYLEIFSYMKKVPSEVIVKRIKNPYIDRIINKMRKTTGVLPIAKENAARSSMKALRQKKLVAVLVDQWAGPEGIWTNFFGRKTSTTSIAVRLAQQTGARLLMGFCIRVKPGYYRFEFHEEIPITDKTPETERKVTERINRDLEMMIRRYPEQWTWGHRRWKAKPDSIRKI